METTDMIFGTRAVMEAIKARREIENLYIQSVVNNDLHKQLVRTAIEHKVPYSFVPAQKLNRLSGKNHQGVIGVLSSVRYASLETIIDQCFQEGRDPFLLIVDRVTDVRNLGALIRTAECAKLDAVIISDKGSAPITGDAMKTSAGALSYVPVCRVKDMSKTIQYLQERGLQVVACTEKTTNSLYSVDLKMPLAIIVGSEEDGISPQLLKIANHLAMIPMRGKIESLNVSVAAGIIIYEAVKQKYYQ